jgi:pyruvate/2-oxoglutarate dehydrogenase complex dihydrolipoamide acyltransferase (E2) component
MMRFGAAVLIFASVHAPSAAFNGELVISRKRGRLMKLKKMLLSVDDDAEENLHGDWREFRAKLMGGGFGLAADDQSSSEKQVGSDDSVSEEAAAAAAAAAAEAAAKNQAVAPRNQALLREQNSILADEYARSWAHATVYPEVGGLLLRRPFEAELLSCKGYWQDHIYKAARRDFLRSSAMDSEQMSTPEATDARFKTWTANQPYMIRLTERIIRREISEIVKRMGNLGDNRSGSSKGNKLSAVTPQQRQLIEKFTAYSESWRRFLTPLRKRYFPPVCFTHTLLCSLTQRKCCWFCRTRRKMAPARSS